ncbi:MAG: hypothetical protein GXP10_03860, partial [Gammaproteobacteria bacterium]|nr:hypothetical protein [Gammaproteobacteria bacterium]
MFTRFTSINALKGHLAQLSLLSSLLPAAVLLAIALLLPNSLHASLLETLMMPGDLIAGHAKYEADCDTCHNSFNKEKQRELCLECHEDVASDITLAKGLHGLRKEITEAECKS